MILPIYAYGHTVLRRRAEEMPLRGEELQQFIADMWETMYNASGIGLAAPQVGKSWRLFVIDTLQASEDADGLKGVFIHPEIVETSAEEVEYEEGCLSIPDVYGSVLRPQRVRLRYMDEHLQWHERDFDGVAARVIQHEYDHLEGRLFTDLLKPLKRARIQKKLDAIRKGKVKTRYPMIFP